MPTWGWLNAPKWSVVICEYIRVVHIVTRVPIIMRYTRIYLYIVYALESKLQRQ